MVRVLLPLALALTGCAGDRDREPVAPFAREAREREALCGNDASCLRRLQLKADGAAARDAPAAAPAVSGRWFCFEGGLPNDPVGACEKSRDACAATERAAREAGVRVTIPCAARRAAACLGVVQGQTAVVFCAPSMATCERMERKLTAGDYEPFAPCEATDA